MIHPDVESPLLPEACAGGLSDCARGGGPDPGYRVGFFGRPVGAPNGNRRPQILVGGSISRLQGTQNEAYAQALKALVGWEETMLDLWGLLFLWGIHIQKLRHISPTQEGDSGFRLLAAEDVRLRECTSACKWKAALRSPAFPLPSQARSACAEMRKRNAKTGNVQTGGSCFLRDPPPKQKGGLSF